MIKPVFIVFGCLALGNIIVSVTGMPLPASIVGMLLLTILLMTKWVKVEDLKGLGDFFNAHMSFFFVPAGVSVMLYLDVIEGQFLPIVVLQITHFHRHMMQSHIGVIKTSVL